MYRHQSIGESEPLDSQGLRRVSQAFGVGYYVHGTYQRLGDRIRVVARLVDVGSGEVRTQESLTDDFSNLLKLEDDLAIRFGSKLEASTRLARGSAHGNRAESTNCRSLRVGGRFLLRRQRMGCQRERNASLSTDYYRMAIRIDPRLFNAYGNLSYNLSWSGEPEAAVAAADEGLATAPGNVNLLRAKALGLLRLRRIDDAERAFRPVIAGVPANSAQDHLILGGIALARADSVRAAREFETTLSIMPTAAMRLAVARAYLDNNQLESGLAQLDRAVAMEPACSRFVATSPAYAPSRDAPQFHARLAAWKAGI